MPRRRPFDFGDAVEAVEDMWQVFAVNAASPAARGSGCADSGIRDQASGNIELSSVFSAFLISVTEFPPRVVVPLLGGSNRSRDAICRSISARSERRFEIILVTSMRLPFKKTK
jgi:hypothetical protein